MRTLLVLLTVLVVFSLFPGTATAGIIADGSFPRRDFSEAGARDFALPVSRLLR